MKHKDWSFVTVDLLEDLHSKLGTWKLVGEHLGIEKGTFVSLRRRLGMKMLDFPDKTRRSWRGSRLDAIGSNIIDLAASGLNCGEIAREIGEVDPEIVRDWLQKHDIQRVSVGAPHGSLNPNWKGGMSVDPDGYILVTAPANHPGINSHGYVRLHRLVAEKKMGRFLTNEEVVHHIDGNVKNNDPDNLEVFPDNGSHLKVEWSDPDWAEHQREIRCGVPSKRRNHTQ